REQHRCGLVVVGAAAQTDATTRVVVDGVAEDGVPNAAVEQRDPLKVVGNSIAIARLCAADYVVAATILGEYANPVAERVCPRVMGPDEFPLDLAVGAPPKWEPNAVPRDEFPGAGGCPPDDLSIVQKDQARLAVAHRGGTRDVSADVVAFDLARTVS